MVGRKAWILGVIAAFLLSAGCALAEEVPGETTEPAEETTAVELQRSVETQFGLSQKFMERAGLVGTTAEEPPAEEPPTEEPALEEEPPAEEPPTEEPLTEEPALEEEPPALEEEVEETMPPEIAAMVAERHAFIGWAKMNDLPASRKIQEQAVWGAVWSSVQAQVATGTTVQEAMAAAQTGLTEEQTAELETLKGTPPGQLDKVQASTKAGPKSETAATASSKGKSGEAGKSEGKGSGKDGKDGKGGGKGK